MIEETGVEASVGDERLPLGMDSVVAEELLLGTSGVPLWLRMMTICLVNSSAQKDEGLECPSNL